jgi:hypothetical protein
MLGEILVHARRTPFWYQNNSVTYKLLKLCLMEGTLEDVLCVLCSPIIVPSRYGHQRIEETETSELIGIPDINYYPVNCPICSKAWMEELQSHYTEGCGQEASSA